jgi:hypothetical protein
MNAEDDASFGAFLAAEAHKAAVGAPYHQYVQSVLGATAEALEHDAALDVELEYAYAVLQDGVSPNDPSSFRDELLALVARAVSAGTSIAALQASVDELLTRTTISPCHAK